MNNFQFLHHANILLGNENDAPKELKSNLKEMGFDTRGNPDYFEQTLNVFGIDEARNLSLWSYGKPIAGDKKIAVIVTESITHEAQNALLKTLEEPSPQTYFFLIMRNIGGLLDTLLSRMHIHFQGRRRFEVRAAANFIKIPLSQKIAFIRELAKEEDKVQMRDLVKNLESVLYQKTSAENMKKVLLAKKFISARGSSPKMILEWLTTSLLKS